MEDRPQAATFSYPIDCARSYLLKKKERQSSKNKRTSKWDWRLNSSIFLKRIKHFRFLTNVFLDQPKAFRQHEHDFNIVSLVHNRALFNMGVSNFLWIPTCLAPREILMQEFSPNIENSFKVMLTDLFFTSLWTNCLLNLFSGGALVLSVHFKVV